MVPGKGYRLGYLSDLKNSSNNVLDSFAIGRRLSVVLGWSTRPGILPSPRVGSAAPEWSSPDRVQKLAPARITQGARVTYSLHSLRYLAPKVLDAVVMAKISAWAVTSVSFSV